MNRTAAEITVKKADEIIHSDVYASFPVVFGRGKACHISLPHFGFLSQTHGCVYTEGNSLVVEDVDSKNGIMVEGKRITSVHFDENLAFEIGPLSFSVRKVSFSVSEEDRSTFEFTKGEGALLTVAPQRLPPPASTSPSSAPPLKTDRRADSRMAFSEIETQIQNPSLRAVIFWHKDVFDVRQFETGDSIFVGSSPTDPLILPTCTNRLFLGRVEAVGGASIMVPPNAKWSGQGVVGHGPKPNVQSQTNIIRMSAGSLLQIELESNITVQFSFCDLARPFQARTWIENKEEFKAAIRVSSLIHTIICLVAFFGAPKATAPKINNMEVRFAKLLVEPPKQIMAAPLPKALPPPEPPKAEAEVPETPKKQQPEAKVAKTRVKSKRTNQPHKTVPVTNPTDQLLSALDSLSTPTPNQPVNLKGLKNEVPSETQFSTNQMMNTLKSKSGKLANQPSADMNASLSQSAKYRNIAGLAGDRQIKGSVVGRPQLSGGGGAQGLSNKEVMAAINKHIGEIQQCYERSLLENNNLNGRVEYEWTITKGGSVSDVRVKKSEISGGDALNDCVMGVIRKTPFPVAKNGQPTVVSIGFPFGRQ